MTDLLASYEHVGGLNNRDAHNMPSTRAVGQICEDLLQLLFPGFHDDDTVHHGSLAELTNERLNRVTGASRIKCAKVWDRQSDETYGQDAADHAEVLQNPAGGS